MKKGTRIFLFVILAALALMLTPQHPYMEEDPEVKNEMLCVLYPDMHYGLNNALVQKFAYDLSIDAEVINAKPGANYLDSLRMHTVDLVIMKYNDSLERGGLMASRMFMDSTVWVTLNTSPQNMRTVNLWINDIEGSSYYDHTRRSLMKGRGGRSISQYDYLVKRNAARIGWDWRLVSAVIAAESNFKTWVQSNAGATGLMQVMPSEEYDADTLVDPAVNLAVGTFKLFKYQRTYLAMGADSSNSVKLTLAGYNGGQGRMKACVEYAQENGIDPTSWDEMAEILPVVCFHAGEQMVAYVNRVVDKYGEYCILYNY